MYLRRFVDPEVLRATGREVIWVYEKNKPARSGSPEKEARIRDYYTLNTTEGPNTEVEDYFSRIESYTAPLLERLDRIGYEPTTEEREVLALFAGLLYTRTPYGREVLDTRSGPAVTKLLTDAAKDRGEFRRRVEEAFSRDVSDEEIEELRGEVLSGKLSEFDRSDEASLSSVVHVGKMCAEALLALDWQFVIADENEMFLTSDCPVLSCVWDEIPGETRFRVGFGFVGADIQWPLGRKLMLRMRKGIEQGWCSLRDRGVRGMNSQEILCAHTRVFAAESSPGIQKVMNERGCTIRPSSFQPMHEGKPIEID